VWTRNEKTLSIEILPPFWATKWAYLIYFIAGLAALYYIVINYHKRTQIKKEKEIYEAKIDFFTNVAHEIRTPLTLIKGPLEFLAEKKDQVPEIRDDVNTIERNTNRLIALVTQILDFRKTEIKGFSLDFAKVDISQLLTESVEGFRSLAKNKSLTMNLELPENDVIAYADEEALIKIFSNLLSNAVKYAREKISIRLSPIKKEDESLTLEVTNDGDPIPAEMKEKIFEPFFRLKQQHKHKGTGIGLSLARSLAELHNGSLYLDDTREDKLNTFILSLPLKPAAGEVTKLKKNKPTLNL
jgi:signal transduction histidine kinase